MNRTSADRKRRHPGIAAVLVPLMALVALLVLPSPAAAELPQSLSALLQSAGTTAELAAARNSYETAQLEAVAAGYRGDLLLSLTPAWKASWLAGEDPDPYHELTATVAATVPLGLSAADRVRLERAIARLSAAEAELSRALLDTVVTLYSGYAAAYSSWAEIPVLEAEHEAALTVLNAEEARYDIGEISLIDLFKLREDYRRARQALDTGTMRAELALLDLLVRSGTEIPPRLPSADAFAPASPLTDIGPFDVPPLETALAQIERDHPRIAAQTAMLDAAIAQTSVARDPLLSSLRLVYSAADDQSGSISYSFARPSLSLSYTPAPLGIGSELPATSGRSGSDSDKDSVTLQAVFSLGVGSSRRQEQAAAGVAAQYEVTRLEALQRSLEADIRARLRRVAAADAAVELALQAQQRARASLDAIVARDALGLAAPAELSAARAAVLRAQLSSEQAAIDLVGAQLLYLAVAHLPAALPDSIYHILFGGSR